LCSPNSWRRKSGQRDWRRGRASRRLSAAELRRPAAPLPRQPQRLQGHRENAGQNTTHGWFYVFRVRLRSAAWQNLFHTAKHWPRPFAVIARKRK
jgi:hypothetical protein